MKYTQDCTLNFVSEGKLANESVKVTIGLECKEEAAECYRQAEYRKQSVELGNVLPSYGSRKTVLTQPIENKNTRLTIS